VFATPTLEHLAVVRNCLSQSAVTKALQFAKVEKVFEKIKERVHERLPHCIEKMGSKIHGIQPYRLVKKR
jgi:hypothetical protein